MKKYLLLCFMVTGCGFDASYRPTLATQPKDSVKYEKDRADCYSETKARQQAANSRRTESGKWLLGGLGLAGNAIERMSTDSSDDANKTPMQIFDECISAKGYQVISQN